MSYSLDLATVTREVLRMCTKFVSVYYVSPCLTERPCAGLCMRMPVTMTQWNECNRLTTHDAAQTRANFVDAKDITHLIFIMYMDSFETSI